MSTRRSELDSSYGTIGKLEDMSDYKTLTETDLNEVLNLNELFHHGIHITIPVPKDLYFLGIKRGGSNVGVFEKYVQEHVVCTSSNIRT